MIDSVRSFLAGSISLFLWQPVYATSTVNTERVEDCRRAYWNGHLHKICIVYRCLPDMRQESMFDMSNLQFLLLASWSRNVVHYCLLPLRRTKRMQVNRTCCLNGETFGAAVAEATRFRLPQKTTCNPLLKCDTLYRLSREADASRTRMAAMNNQQLVL